MKKIIYLLIPIILVGIIVYGIYRVFFLGDLGKGALQVTSKPFSKVYLNDSYIGTTPLCKCEATEMIRNGEYTIKLVPVDEKTAEFQDKITITKGVLTVVDRKFGTGATSEGSIVSLQKIPDKKSSELLVLTFPDKADVYVDSNYQGTSPYHMKSLTDSDHTLRIKKDGYRDKSVRIRTPGGFKLVAVVYLGLYDESTEPSSAPQPTISGLQTPTPTLSSQVKVTILDTPNGFLRVRSEPAINSQEITRVNTGDTFDFIEETEGWLKVKLPDGSNGWISSDYASKK